MRGARVLRGPMEVRGMGKGPPTPLLPSVVSDKVQRASCFLFLFPWGASVLCLKSTWLLRDGEYVQVSPEMGT